MASSEESEEMPMLATTQAGGFAGRPHTSIELSSMGSADHRYFSGPLLRNPITNNSPVNLDDVSTSALGKRFYSGPIHIPNDAPSSSTTVPHISNPGRRPVSNPTRRLRLHSHANNEHLLRSGPLGKCNDPFCTTCPLYIDNRQPGLQSPYYMSSFDQEVNATFQGRLKKMFANARVWGLANMPGVMNPHTKRVQQWNKFFLISCLIAVFVDPLFFYILSVDPDSRCIYFNLTFAKVITVMRSATDLVYFLHMLLQSRLAYLEPSSVGSGALIDNPRAIIKNYLTGWFTLDVIVVLPLPQITMWVIIPQALGTEHAAQFTKNLLRVIVLVQYFPRMIRRVDMQLRRHDVESWMARRHLPLKFRRKVREAERFKWAANRGVDEQELLNGLPEDIELEIRKALCLELIKKVRLFTYMEEQVLDEICQRLRQSLYINGSVIMRKNHPIEKMHFFIKGNVQRTMEDGKLKPLQSGFCGEELLTWCLEFENAQQPSVKRTRHRSVIGQHAISSTTVTCLGSVEAFSLSAEDLKEVTRLYSNFLRNNKVQGALRYESLYWRTRAAITIQGAWRKIRSTTKTTAVARS